MSKSSGKAQGLSKMRAVVLTMVPNGGAVGKAMQILGYTPYRLEDTFTKGRALTHPQEWLAVLEGQKAFDASFLRRSPNAKAELPHYDCLVGPPATMAFESILATCPRETKVILVEEGDKTAWAKDMEIVIATVSNYKRHSGPGVVLFNMITIMMDFYRCSSSTSGKSRSLYRHRLLGNVPTAERLAGSLELFEEHVKKTVPSDRLLIYRVGEGWDPLTSFLGLDSQSRIRETDGSLMNFPLHDNGLDTLVTVRDALSISRSVVAAGFLILLSLLFVVASSAAKGYREELAMFYQYTRKKFEPYFNEEAQENPPSISFYKSMVLAKKSVLEYGQGMTEPHVPQGVEKGS